MSATQRVAAVVLLSAWLCPQAFAPIFGTYPGLHSLIGRAEVIAAITILDQLSDEDMGGAARYKIMFDKVLKGTAPEKQAIAYIRYLDIIPEAELLRSPPPEGQTSTRYFAPPEGFRPFAQSSRWIAFLTKARPDVEAAYENVNCSGSTFPLSPLRDLEALKVESLSDALILLFREYVDYRRTELKKWEKQVDAFIHERDE